MPHTILYYLYVNKVKFSSEDIDAVDVQKQNMQIGAVSFVS